MTSELNQVWKNIQQHESSKALIFLAAKNLMVEINSIKNAEAKLGGLED